MKYCEHKAQLLWARVQMVKATGGTYGRGFRYDLSDFVKQAWPAQDLPPLIPKTTEARRHRSEGRKVRFEHAVPLNVLFRLMSEAETIEQMMETVRKYYQACHVTLDEDTRLNQAGLRSRMPADWDGQDIYARYEAVGIKL